MILKMSLEGFRQYKRKQHISFSSGLNLIQGTNDAGKSTIFYALEYALFGLVQGFQGLQPLKNWDRTVNKIWVQIEYLSKDNKQFKLTRWHDFTRSGAKGHFHLKLVDNGSERPILDDNSANLDQLQDLIIKQLGITKRMFQVVVNSQQGKHRDFLDGDKKLDFLFGITASQRLNSLFHEYSRELMNTGQREKEQADENIIRLNDDLEGVLKSIDEETKEKEIIEGQIVLIKEQLEKLQAIDLTGAQKAIKSLEEKEEKIKRTETSISNITEELDGLIRTHGSVEEIKDKISEITTQIRIKEKLIHELTEEIEDLRNQVSNLDKILGDFKGQLKRHRTQEGKSVCEYCGSEIDPQEFQQKITQLTRSIKTNEQEIERINNQINSLQQEASSILDEKIKEEKTNTTLENIEKRYDEIIHKKEELNQELEKSKNILIKEKDSVLEIINDVLEEVRRTVPHLIKDELIKTDTVDDLRESISDINATLGVAIASNEEERKGKRALLNQYERQLTQLETRKSKIESEIQKNEDEKEKAEEKLQKSTLLEIISDGFQKFLNEQRTTLKSNLQEKIRNWYNELAATRQYVGMVIDPSNYKLSVIPAFSPTREAVPASKNSGGGHQTLLALAYKLAVAETIGRPSFLLIDEPTDGADTENLENLLECLPNLSNVFSQTFMITHHGLAQEKANNIIEVTHSKGQSLINTGGIV